MDPLCSGEFLINLKCLTIPYVGNFVGTDKNLIDTFTLIRDYGVYGNGHAKTSREMETIFTLE